MKLTDYAKREGAVLEWVNEVRKRLGRDGPKLVLPSGNRNGAHTCPIALALGAGFDGKPWVTQHAYGFGGEPTGRSLPHHVSSFIRDFDAGEFPWLEVRDA